MKNRKIGIKILLPALLLALAAAVPAETATITVPLRFDRYYSLEQVYEAVQAIGKAYPEMAKVEEVGKSDEGRPVYAVTVNNPKTGPAMSKPAVYVDGNMHGNEIQGGEICLYLLDYLLGGYGKNPEATAIVDKTVFYVVPVANVDGRFHFLQDANTSSSNRTVRLPMDDDRDGLMDEDAEDDLDGDGNICTMRRKDPFGMFRTDPEDPRLMIRVKPGEKGEWTIMGDEGIDNDGDGQINEDGPGYVDPNRQWGYDWAPEYVQQGSGEYPFQSLGLRALGRWIQGKTNICMAWTFHNFGGMYLRGPSRKGLGEYPPQDVAVYDYIGKQAERITPGYRYMISWKDLYTTYGDSLEWLCQTVGSYGYCGEVYQTQAEAFKALDEKKPDEGKMGMESLMSDEASERERLRFSDNVTLGDLYKPWKAFKHPVYGDVEIGGWVKMSSRLPAPFMMPDLVHRNAMAVLFSAKHVPEVTLDVTEVKKIEKDLYRVRVRLANGKAMPTMTYQAQKVKLHPKDTLTVSGAKVVAGGVLTDPFNDRASYKKDRPEIQFLVVPGFGKADYQFLVQGKGEITIKYQSRKAGTLEKKAKLE